MAQGLTLDAVREQAKFVVQFDLYDVPKRMVSMGIGAACLWHFASLELAMVPVALILALEVLGRVLNLTLPASTDDFKPWMIAVIYLRVAGSVAAFCLFAILLVLQPNQMALAVGLMFIGGVTIHTMASHALMSILQWILILTISICFATIMAIIPTQVYAASGPDDLTVFYACSAIWIGNLFSTTLRQGRTRATYAEAIGVAKDRARKLDYFARHDALTGLLNRRAFDELLLDAIQFTDRKGPIALLAIDLDGFKPINDAHGHAAGDAALVELSKRIISVAGVENSARVGGDEFAVLFRQVEGRFAVKQSAIALKSLLCQPFEYDGVTIELGASVGVAFSERAGDTISALCARADAAMYHAKTEQLAAPVFSDEISAAKTSYSS